MPNFKNLLFTIYHTTFMTLKALPENQVILRKKAPNCKWAQKWISMFNWIELNPKYGMIGNKCYMEW